MNFLPRKAAVPFLAMLLAARVPAAFAAQAAAEPPKPLTVVKAPSIKFRPLTTNAPSVRVTGGSRGAGDALITLDVLAPADTGLTTQEQPSLFWFQSKPSDARFELTLLQENRTKPLVRIRADHATRAGIQRVKLSDHGVKLEPGVEYQWVVALITDPENRSTDLIASGAIKRVEAPSELKAKLAAAGPGSRPAVYAEAGLWYDALDAVSSLVDSGAKDADPRSLRAELLSQVGLKAAAAADAAK